MRSVLQKAWKHVLILDLFTLQSIKRSSDDFDNSPLQGPGWVQDVIVILVAHQPK